MDGGGWDPLLQSMSDKRPAGQPVGPGTSGPTLAHLLKLSQTSDPAGRDLLPPSVRHWSRSEGLPKKSPVARALAHPTACPHTNQTCRACPHSQVRKQSRGACVNAGRHSWLRGKPGFEPRPQAPEPKLPISLGCGLRGGWRNAICLPSDRPA